MPDAANDTAHDAPRSSPTDADEKWSAYASTILEFAGPPRLTIDLRRPVTDGARRALVDRGLPSSFAVLTAENPRGTNPEDAPTPSAEERREARNDHRVSALDRALERERVAFEPVDGMAPDGSYRERCVAVCMPREAATDLARRLEQLALFWYDGHDFWLMPAAIGEEPERLPRA
jgi:hypothetical protein